MLTESVASRRLGEGYTRIEHPSGLTLMLCPMKGYSTAYALFAARCGSIDDSFSTGDGEMVQVPNGIAHFLEHKLFESEGTPSSSMPKPAPPPTPILPSTGRPTSSDAPTASANRWRFC